MKEPIPNQQSISVTGTPPPGFTTTAPSGGRGSVDAADIAVVVVYFIVVMVTGIWVSNSTVEFFFHMTRGLLLLLNYGYLRNLCFCMSQSSLIL